MRIQRFNDKFGHLMGDEVLKTVARTLMESLKGRDVVARFGRQPHRNAVLGRISTPEEIEYLARGEFVHERAPPRQGDGARLP